jgi:hypothetical protein
MARATVKPKPAPQKAKAPKPRSEPPKPRVQDQKAAKPAPAPAAGPLNGGAKPERPPRPVVVQAPAGPPAYEAVYADTVREAGARGATYSDILLLLGITSPVALLWRMCYPAFDMAFNEAQKLADELRTARVEDALYERAKGFEFMSEKIVTVGNEIRRVPVLERVHADVGAAKYWLEGRNPERWMAVRQSVDVRLRVARITEDMTPAEAAELFRSTLEGALIEGELAAPTETAPEPTEDIGD